MTRFFTKEILRADVAMVQLEDIDARHARDVLRLRAGDRFILCDGAMRDHECEIVSLSREGAIARVVSVSDNMAEPVYDAILYQGLPKGDKMDEIVRKCVELGVTRVVPVACARSITQWAAADRGMNAKIERLQRIAREAAKQCGRGRVPEILPPIPFSEAVRDATMADFAFLPWENERETSIRSLLEEFRAQKELGSTSPRPVIAFLIGPEGGFEAGEVAAALGAGIRPVTLGRRILRTETAGPAVLAMMTCLLDEFRAGMLYNESLL